MTNHISLFDLVPGNELLGRYRIVRPHRQGTMAANFEALDLEGGERRELQVFPGGLFEDRGQAADFAERLGAWREVANPAVLVPREVRVFDDGSVLLVTDFPIGRSLRGWMKDHARMEARAVRALAIGLLEGLETVHAADLAHGDLKPAAVRYRPDEDRGVLLDGGITPALWAAKHLGTRTALIGTPYYAPIEQFSGDQPDALSDLYSLCTVLYELVTGVLPWSGTGFVEVFQSKMQPGPPSMAERAPGVPVDAELERAIVKGLCAARTERYASAGELHDRLARIELE